MLSSPDRRRASGLSLDDFEVMASVTEISYSWRDTDVACEAQNYQRTGKNDTQLRASVTIDLVISNCLMPKMNVIA